MSLIDQKRIQFSDSILSNFYTEMLQYGPIVLFIDPLLLRNEVKMHQK